MKTFSKTRFRNGELFKNTEIQKIEDEANRLFSIDEHDPELNEYRTFTERAFRFDHSPTTKDTILVCQSNLHPGITDEIRVVVDFAGDDVGLVNNVKMPRKDMELLIDKFNERVELSTVEPTVYRSKAHLSYYDIVGKQKPDDYGPPVDDSDSE